MSEPTVKDLADAVSTQVRVANRYWLAVVVLGLFVTAPPKSSAGTVQLPLGLGQVDEGQFGFIVVMLVSALVVAFCSAHAQVLRVQAFINSRLDAEPAGGSRSEDRDFYDSLREPAVTRVAPLAQILRGRNQFFSGRSRVSPTVKYVTGAYYLYLKFLTVVIYFGIPALALWVAVSRYSDAPAPVFGNFKFTWPFVAGASLALLQIGWHEIAGIWRTWNAITS